MPRQEELNLAGKCGQEELEKKKFSPNLVKLTLASNGLDKLHSTIFNERCDVRLKFIKHSGFVIKKSLYKHS